MPFSTLHQPCLTAAVRLFFPLFLPRIEDSVLTLVSFQILDICSFVYSSKQKQRGRLKKLLKQRFLPLLNVYKDKKF